MEPTGAGTGDDEWESIAADVRTGPGGGAKSAASTTAAAAEAPVPHGGSGAAEPVDGSRSRGDRDAPAERLSLVPRARGSAPHASAPGGRSSESRLLAVQETLERRRRLQDKLFHHPVRILWTRFLGYLLGEVWGLDLRIRLALTLIAVGFLTKCLLFSTAVLWYPRLFLIPTLIVVPFLYLNPSYVPVTLERFVQSVQDVSSLTEKLSELDTTTLRRLCCAALFVPTLLEIRTIQFLSEIRVEASWGLVYHLLVAMLNATAMVTAFTKFNKSPRECTHIGLLGLYGSALFIVTFIQFDFWKMPLLVAPFFLATGILLLHSVDDNYEWCTRSIRHALRLSLRDALSLVGDSVSQDEMLQLAMLRWLVDYWGSSPPPPPPAPSGHHAAPPHATTAPMDAMNAESSHPPTSLVTVPRERQLSWGELLPMLSMTSEQIRTEVDALHPGAHATPQPAEHHLTASSLSPRPSSGPSTSSSFASGSVTDFQTMLASMDLDAHAKPAVMAYKRAVESFPPSREMAILLSVTRRCPALLALLWELFGSKSVSVTSLAVLVPFIVFELIRCKHWSESCKRAATRVSAPPEPARGEALFLENVDPIVILLSGDKLSLHRPPTLLGVWMNVVSSVSALEMGLTTVRCVQTTAAAIDFAQNVMSLAEFGYEVASRGWMHGAGVLAKELVIHHTRSSEDQPTRAGTKYTSAALKAMESSRRVSRNMQVLMEEENPTDLVPPFMGFMSAAVGRGWLWGRDDAPRPKPSAQSTVVIEELDDSSSEAREASISLNAVASEPSQEVALLTSQPVKPSSQSTLQIEVLDSTCSEGNNASNSLNVVEFGPLQEEALLNEGSDIPEVMDLIAAASSRQLIDPSEKNELCERLLRFQSSSPEDISWLLATKRTLEGLILIDNRAEGAIPDNSKEDSQPMEDPRATIASGHELEFELFEPLMQPHSGSESADRSHCTTLPRSDEANELEDITGTEELSGAVAPQVQLETASEQVQSSGDNIWMQLGGGLAVVGAVAGVAAIALQNNARHDRRRHENRHHYGGLPSQ